VTELLDDVEVGLIDLDAPDPDADAVLSPSERVRRDRYHRALDARRFARGRAELRRRLAREIGTTPEAVELVMGPHGKPHVEGVTFNLSHANQWAVLAVSARGRVGIDIEATTRSVDVDAVGQRVFSAEELQLLNGLTDTQRRDAFFDLWTLKEAALKAAGTGLNVEPSTFTLLRTPSPKVVSTPDGTDPSGWAIKRLGAPSGFRVGIAITTVP
jgi:4'-phosphopantetheinyl transferase